MAGYSPIIIKLAFFGNLPKLNNFRLITLTRVGYKQINKPNLKSKMTGQVPYKIIRFN